MKISARIIILTLIAGLILAFFLWRSRAPGNSNHSAPPQAELTTPESHPLPEGTDASVNSGTNFGQTESVTASNAERMAHEHQISEAMQDKNVSIRFWGKVVNQEDKPLSGANIKAHVRTWTSMQTGMTAFPKITATSMSDGSFELGGLSGDVLAIEAVEMKGYEVEPSALKSFGFNTSEQFRSNPDSPVLFRMWATNVHQQLLTGQKSLRIEPDGESHSIDFETNSIDGVSEGALKASIKYTQDPALERADNWVAELVVTNGGLVEENDPNSSMYLAPTGGYTSTFRYSQQIKNGQRGSIGTKRFFLMLKDGQSYGRITVEMIAPYNGQIPGLIRIQYTINSSGSRVLR